MDNLSLTRAAQSAYNKAGFPRDEAFLLGEQVARYVNENLATMTKLCHTDDEVELAYRLAQAIMAFEREQARS